MSIDKAEVLREVKMTMRADFCPDCEPTTAGHAPGCPNEPYLPSAAGKNMEPVNHTFILSFAWNTETGEGSEGREDVFYKDCPNYEHMPDITRVPETKAEHAAWWAWYKRENCDLC